jgi:uncharacterized protein (DUF2235 family)
MTNIAVFLDGTGNYRDESNEKNTNVFKLYQSALSSGHICHYIRGVGTDYSSALLGPARKGPRWRDVVDQAFGRGATLRIKDAYRFIAQRYRPEDQLFLFGFSRGAFFARALAGFLDKVGLLSASAATEKFLEFAFYLYWKDIKGYRFYSFLRNMRTHFMPETASAHTFLGNGTRSSP